MTESTLTQPEPSAEIRMADLLLLGPDGLWDAVRTQSLPGGLPITSVRMTGYDPDKLRSIWLDVSRDLACVETLHEIRLNGFRGYNDRSDVEILCDIAEPIVEGDIPMTEGLVTEAASVERFEDLDLQAFHQGYRCRRD